MLILADAQCFTPESIGRRDVLVGGSTVLAISESRLDIAGVERVELDGKLLLPGLVDSLTHPCGGGGEGGYGNRTEEISADTFLAAGVTTPVGALGTDSIGRSLDVLYGCIMGLRSLGLAARMYGGAYRVPTPTLTGDVARDLYLVEPVIGMGEVAIADHRGTQPDGVVVRQHGVGGG